MNIVVIGGGTGTSSVLSGLKYYPDLSITAIVTMMDDGGSNEVVRDEFGLLPLSDARKSILALSTEDHPDILRKLFMYRFNRGKGLSGHTLGNLMMIALSEITGSEKRAIKAFSDLFEVKGKVLPVTSSSVKLVAKFRDGKKAEGEHNIDTNENKSGIKELKLSNFAKADKEAVKEILKADYIIIGPGDLYTTILPNILVKGIREAINKSRAKIVYISNLMSKKGETRGMTHQTLLLEVEKYLKKSVNYVLINKTDIPTRLLKKYKKDGESIFKDDIKRSNYGDRKIIRADLISDFEIIKVKGDKIKRSLIRHDSDKLARELYHIFRKSIFNYFSELISRN